MESQSKERRGPPSHLRRVALTLAVIAVLALFIWLAPVETWVMDFVDWVDGSGTVGMVVYALLFIVGVVVFVPTTVFSIGAGFLFGLVPGLILSGICVALGAWVTFVVGRYLARDAVQRKVRELPKFQAMERAISMEGFKMAFLTRLVPIFPFTVLNYLFGVTRMGVRRFVVATSLGMLPATAAYVYLGAMAGDLKRALAMGNSPTAATYLMWAAGVLSVVAIVWLITRRAKQELDFLMSQKEKDSLDAKDVEDGGGEVV